MRLISPRRFFIATSLAAVACLAWFALFYKLGHSPLLPWDEAHNAVNALEMAQSGQWLVTTYDGEPDFVYTKPPVGIWLMAASIRALGPSEFAIRLPSALAALATVVLLVAFAVTHGAGWIGGISSSVVLLTSLGFLGNHVSRSGDLDALLALFITAASLAWYRALEGELAGRTRALTAFAICLGLALLTKGTAVLMFLPGLWVFALFRRRYWILRSKQVYAALFAALVPVVMYHLVRELVQPGFIAAAWHNYGLGRFLGVQHGHSGRMTYYVNWFVYNARFLPWVYVFPIAVGICLAATRSHTASLGAFGLCLVSSGITILSLARTKLWWYDAPLYPLMALTIGAAVADLWRRLSHPLARAVLAVALVFCLQAIPHERLLRTIEAGETTWPFHADEAGVLGYRDHIQQVRTLVGASPWKIICSDSGGMPAGPCLFYAARARLEGAQIRLAQLREAQAGDYVTACLLKSRAALAEWTGSAEVRVDTCLTVRAAAAAP